LEINNLKKLYFFFGILTVIVGFIVWIVAEAKGLNYHPSLDVTLSNLYLCKNVDGECLVLDNQVFVSEDFSDIKICANYSSSQPTKIQIFLIYQEVGPFIGMFFDDIGEGDFEICYLLNDVVESLEDSNMGGKNPSPVNDGVIEPGRYRIVFEQGREKLTELKFIVRDE
jgi:hypothetical protein